MSAWQRLQFGPVVLGLAVLAAAGVAGLTVAGFGYASLGFLVVPMALGIWYLVATHVPTPPPPVVADEEPFDDPVELADREDQLRQSSEETAPTPEPAAPGRDLSD